MSKQNKLAVLTDKDLVIEPIMSLKQMNLIFKKTPANQIKERKAKGGGTWKYVTGAYVKKLLNLMFGFDWDFTVLVHKFDLNIKQAYVHGRLEVRVHNKRIIREQFGRADIKFLTKWENGKKITTDQPLDIGNDLKAAATDALKKCASELGLCQDIYAENEYKELFLVEESTIEDQREQIQKLLDDESIVLNESDRMNIERILDQNETASYLKVLKTLTKLKKTK